ncbi:MAG: fibronectin type III domain-containing protein, partial [Gammaproteobacteria bacterium]|nr:fibronectin type III domain-containing protein [Gammaproteobacteria bacterium]
MHSATLAAGPGAFHIAWIPNRIVEGSPPPAITGWKVLYRKSGTTTWSEVDISDADARSHTQTGLDSETAYEVQVAATNSTGTGVLPASPYTVTTLAGSLSSSSIPQPPANLRATQIGKNLALTWDAPTSGDTVSTYQIRWRVGATTAERDAAPWSSPVQVTQRTLTLAGISGAALYELQVASITGTILSFPALTAWEATLRWPEIIHPEKPTNLSATQSGNNLALTWDAPTGGVTVSTYQVRWRTGATTSARNNAAWSDPVTVKGLSHTIPGISNAVFYQAEVASLTDQLLTFPEFIRWQTRTEGPEVTVLVTPRNFAATRGDGEVTLAWDAPAGAGPYSTYQVRFKTGADEAALTAAQYGDPVAATALTYAITVANNARYMAQVAAINDNEPDFISWDATVQSAAPAFADAAFELPTLYVRADAYSLEFPAATSPDSTPINYTLGGLPANSGLTFAADTRILSGIPTAEAVAGGEATLAYAATDSTAFSVEQQIPIRFGEFDMDVDESGTV